MLYFYNMLPTEENIDYVILNHANYNITREKRRKQTYYGSKPEDPIQTLFVIYPWIITFT